MKPTLHLVGLPHTMATRSMNVCAYTTKAMRFVKMMRTQGYRVVVYWGDESDIDADEQVPVVTVAEQRRWYGADRDPQTVISTPFDANALPWQAMNQRCVYEIGKRREPDDILLVTAGLAQKAIADGLPDMLACEWAVGYEGWYMPHSVCFESHAWRHYCYGRAGVTDGRWYDTVIPNFFDPDDFAEAGEGDDYLLFVGRMIPRKGPQIAAEIAREAGLPLVLAGPGATSWTPDRITCGDWQFDGVDMEYVGTVGIEERARLMGGARAVLAPTTYIEPFGGVAVEAQFCGTPAVTTDWGAFTETVPDAYRFATLAEGVAAVERARGTSPDGWREQAAAKYSLDAVGPRFDRWLRRLGTLRRQGWYEPAEPELVA
jgi:glycosyltransferase involved in cell wall biosynthesis